MHHIAQKKAAEQLAKYDMSSPVVNPETTHDMVPYTKDHELYLPQDSQGWWKVDLVDIT